MTTSIPESLQELSNTLRRALELVVDVDARLSAQPCQCGPCVEARSCGVEMGAWVS